MSESLPPPVTTTDAYLRVILDVLEQIKNGLIDVETELGKTNALLQTLIDKPSVRIDAQLIETLAKKRVK